jgi:hypothetical protein
MYLSCGVQAAGVVSVSFPPPLRLSSHCTRAHHFAAETLSEIVVVVGKGFGAKFIGLWPNFVAFINSNPGNEVRSALLGLVGRVRARVCPRTGPSQCMRNVGGRTVIRLALSTRSAYAIKHLPSPLVSTH